MGLAPVDRSIYGVLIVLIILIAIFAMTDSIHITQLDQGPTAYVGYRTN